MDGIIMTKLRGLTALIGAIILGMNAAAQDSVTNAEIVLAEAQLAVANAKADLAAKRLFSAKEHANIKTKLVLRGSSANPSRTKPAQKIRRQEHPDDKQKPILVTPTMASIALSNPKGVLSKPVRQPASQSRVLNGLLDLPRHEKTASIDGCAKINKGLVMGGGFMLFTCEKLLPFYPIADHARAYRDYQVMLKDAGWSQTQSKEPGQHKKSFKRTDALGCETTMDIELWTDRSMGETMMNIGNRDNHRQIVFKAWFRGEACERHYSTAQLLASR